MIKVIGLLLLLSRVWFPPPINLNHIYLVFKVESLSAKNSKVWNFINKQYKRFLFIYKFFIFHTEPLVCVYIFKKTRFSKHMSEMIGSESVIVTHHTSATSILILRLTHAKCDFDTNEYDLFTQGVISKRIMRFSHDFYTFPKINTSVILTCTSMIYTRKVWNWHARVWFVHAECDFDMHE
jgi:hypothetical protein